MDLTLRGYLNDFLLSLLVR